jgi:hypothetical protein
MELGRRIAGHLDDNDFLCALDDDSEYGGDFLDTDTEQGDGFCAKGH